MQKLTQDDDGFKCNLQNCKTPRKKIGENL